MTLNQIYEDVLKEDINKSLKEVMKKKPKIGGKGIKSSKKARKYPNN